MGANSKRKKGSVFVDSFGNTATVDFDTNYNSDVTIASSPESNFKIFYSDGTLEITYIGEPTIPPTSST